MSRTGTGFEVRTSGGSFLGRRSRQRCGTGISTEARPGPACAREDATRALGPALADSEVFQVLAYFPEHYHKFTVRGAADLDAPTPSTFAKKRLQNGRTLPAKHFPIAI